MTLAQVEPGPIPGAEAFGPWNPGVTSRLPSRLLSLTTIFRPENAFTDLARVKELRGLTGLDFSDLVVFRPERLALHELLIRVTTDLSVSDGSRYEDLGINFRSIVSTILSRYVQPDMPRVVAVYEQCRERLSAIVAQELAAASEAASNTVHAHHAATIRSLVERWTGKNQAAPPPRVNDDSAYLQLADQFEHKAASCADDELRSAALHALARVTRCIFDKVGSWRAASDLVASVALGIACNDVCARRIGQLIDEYLRQAEQREGFRRLPPQQHSVVMNTKGPSASGKSTLRPLQHALADRIGISWTDFALISPDIWRKQLFDYDSLNGDFRYGAMLTSEELAIIDRKLDHYVERKAEQGHMSHLLIDRFRFGSFVFHSERGGDKLLSRLGRQIFFFFMITPPDALVERAWKRGVEYGRYKAVDDLLAHSVEAYAGVPQLFLNWARRTDKDVHFEFLDNSVPLGQPPRTVAFGTSARLFVLDIKGMLDVVRYRKVDVDASGPEQLFRDAGPHGLAGENNVDFLLQCVRQLREVCFADHATGRIYLRIEQGLPVWDDLAPLMLAARDPDTRAGIQAVAPGVLHRPAPTASEPLFITDLCKPERIRTLGDWGHGADDATNRVRT